MAKKLKLFYTYSIKSNIEENTVSNQSITGSKPHKAR